MTVLVTGGLGYIGSHACIELINAGYEVIVIDNLLNSKIDTKYKIEEITGKKIKFHKIDLLNKSEIETIFKEYSIKSVLHFAGLKAVGESVKNPLIYYDNNVTSTINLCSVMQKYNVKKLVFSSSATVYGYQEKMPITENSPLGSNNPYGNTKLIIENILTDLTDSDNSWNISILRYFNPIGAHKSGKIGEKPNGIPNNLMPYITQVAIGELTELRVFGDDYSTVDGTGVRDYIHVVDLVKGHVAALENLVKGIQIYNLGTGKGISVLQLLKTFEKVNKIEIPYKVVSRRQGDIPICYADVTKAKKELGWEAKRDVTSMCRDAWNFEIQENKRNFSKNLW